jgi:group I intron endonuclease
MFVYLITNTVNGKRYVGQHIGNDLQRYWTRKIYLSFGGYKKKQALAYAICKYGPDNFKIEPIAIVDSKGYLDFYEILFIDLFNTKAPFGYNLTEGGEGTVGWRPSPEQLKVWSSSHIGKKLPNKLKGIPRTKETREKISASSKGNANRLGQKNSEEHNHKISIANMGYKPTKETLIKISNALTGRKLSDEHKKKTSNTMKGIVFSPEHRRNLSIANTGRVYSEAARRNMSEAHKGKPRSEKQKFADHKRWHVNRGIINPDCLLCKENQ